MKTLSSIASINKLKSLMVNINNDAIYNNSDITNLQGFLYNGVVFSKYRTAMYDIITGLEAAIQIDARINSITEQFNVAASFENSIKTNAAFLTQYINSKNLEVLPFDVSTIYDQEIMLHPWYAEYLFKYGPPSNGTFDTILLVEIVNDLISTGVITMKDFLDA